MRRCRPMSFTCAYSDRTEGTSRSRYAVLAATAAEALEAVSGGLAFGDRASISDETLTDDQASALALVAGKARMIG